MDFTDIEAPEFLKQLKMFKEMLLAEHGQPEDDFTEITYESMDILMKELKGEKSIDDLSKDKKKTVYPHLALVLTFMEEIIEADEEFDDIDFEDDEDMEDCEETDCEEEEEVEEAEENNHKHGHQHGHGGGCCQNKFIVDLPSSTKPKKKS